MRIDRLHRTDQAYAFIIMLALFVILLGMVMAAMRTNANERMRLRAKRQAIQAMCLAETGVAEALDRIGSGTVKGSESGRDDRGEWSVAWGPVTGNDGLFEVRAVGRADSRVRDSARRKLIVRIRRGSDVRSSQARLRAIFWQTGGF